MRQNDTVIVAWLSNGQVDSKFAMSIARLYSERKAGHGTLRVGGVADLMCDESSGLLSRGRNTIAAHFLDDTDADWLLMIDSDEQLSVDGFDKLCAAAHDTERPIVAGLYFGAWGGEFYPTPVPLIFKRKPGTTRFVPLDDYPRNRVVEIDSAGTGCLLVHRSVFERIRKTDSNPQDPQGRWCWFRDMPVAGDWFSEDHFFCTVAQENGFKLHAHTGVVLPHRKRYWLGEEHHLMSHLHKLTDEEARQPRWAPITDQLSRQDGRPETTEQKPATEKAVQPRVKRSA